MHHRPIIKFRPGPRAIRGEAIARRRRRGCPRRGRGRWRRTDPGQHRDRCRRRGDSRGVGYLAYRITNPTYLPLIPPFQHVLVQKHPARTREGLQLALHPVKNGTAKTFDASDGFTSRYPAQRDRTASKTRVPVLTGNQPWKPGQTIVFYILSKKYYPLSPQVAAGFQFEPRRPVIDARPGALGDLPAAQVQPGDVRQDAGLDRDAWPGCPVGPRHQVRHAGHGGQRVRLRQEPSASIIGGHF